MFTAKDLKEIINSIPDDTPIVLQGDDEGNSYRYMRGIEFIPTGEKSNFYNEDESECLRKEDLEYREVEPETAGYILCAVAY